MTPSFTKNSGSSRQQFNTRGTNTLQQNRGNSTTKQSSRTDLWKEKFGNVNRNTSKIEAGKSPIDVKGKVQTRDIKQQITDRFDGFKSPVANSDFGKTQSKNTQTNKLGSFLGNLSKIQSHIIKNQQRGKVCVDNRHWCHGKPKQCHWWYNWCTPIRYCEPAHYVHCHWNYVTCDYTHGGQVVVEDARWYLGMKGLLLPGQGIGIEEVAPGSPAAQVGLQPGMVITRCNGIDLFDETALGDAISRSGGVLHMDVLLSEQGPPATCVIVMQRIASLRY